MSIWKENQIHTPCIFEVKCNFFVLGFFLSFSVKISNLNPTYSVLIFFFLLNKQENWYSFCSAHLILFQYYYLIGSRRCRLPCYCLFHKPKFDLLHWTIPRRIWWSGCRKHSLASEERWDVFKSTFGNGRCWWGSEYSFNTNFRNHHFVWYSDP